MTNMSITRAIEFYAGRKNVKTEGIFGNFMQYEFHKDIAYSEIPFEEAAKELNEYMINHDIKIAYCDISCDFGGGYSLFKRYTYINKKGTYITKPKKHTF